MASEIGDLTDALSNWEIAGYASIAAVAIGVTGESIHDFTEWLKTNVWWKERGHKASALLLIFALASELIIQIKVNSISGRVIALINKSAEDVRADNLALEGRIAPRRLLSDQKAEFGKSLNWFFRKTVVLESYGLDLEARALGKQIEIALLAAGLKPLDFLSTRSPSGSTTDGIFVSGREKELVDALISEFKAAGLTASDQDSSSSDRVKIITQSGRMPPLDADATIFFGVKPLPE